MAIVVESIRPAPDGQSKAVAIVDMGDGTQQVVAFWPELVTQYTGDPSTAGTPVGDFVVACAQWAAGDYAAARATLQPHATGSYAAGPPVVDTRNWAQAWIDQHPDPAPYTAPAPY